MDITRSVTANKTRGNAIQKLLVEEHAGSIVCALSSSAINHARSPFPIVIERSAQTNASTDC